MSLRQNESMDMIKNPHIEEQQKMIKFEPFEFKEKTFEAILDHQQKLLQDSSMLQACLRRQSLFKLKETINGKVSKQVTEIEQRKLSPYRFSNSPLKLKKYKDSSSGLNSGRVTKTGISPIRVPSIFCKKILRDTPREQYIIKGNKSSLNESDSPAKLREPRLPTESPLIGKASERFFRKMNRNRSVKRLSAKISNQVSSNLSSISENDTTTNEHKTPLVNKQQPIGSPIGKNLIMSKELICSTDSIDL